MNVTAKHRLIYRMKQWRYIGGGRWGEGYTREHAYADWLQGMAR